eukprot:CAMPEP_0182927148 /NCGR_PEP_ID=MMETSP0105_2-20130417/13342_1 /TAXON_ID=81532 ORGANISM="Acanthoeca-like sp., Strain 10tr" /NCGR_SAMPLE_ID=MMETSP0105_2 /ASSEMBLY_ACC=CAM_ASM_000205 /LENGTH=102 /DNA_ID=CAMNT_0025065079 /DNA_START=163 /DNA_END=471 /DNA_ORIENTATION=+
MNSIKSSIAGWGAFSVAVFGGMVAANQWRNERESTQVERGSKDMRIMSMEERIAKAEWEANQAELLAAGKVDQVHPLYLEMEEAKKARQAKVGKSDWDSKTA